MIYGKAPMNLLNDTRISFRDLKIYIALSSFQGKNSSCFPSLSKISERSGVFVSHISKHTKRLQKFGWIEVTRRGKKQSNCYRVYNKSPLSDSPILDKSLLKSDSPILGVSDSPILDKSIVKEHLKEKNENSLLTETQKYYASLNNKQLFKNESKCGELAETETEVV